MKPPGGSTDSLELKMASDKLSEISEDPLKLAAGEFFLKKNIKMTKFIYLYCQKSLVKNLKIKVHYVNLFMLCHTKEKVEFAGFECRQ